MFIFNNIFSSLFCICLTILRLEHLRICFLFSRCRSSGLHPSFQRRHVSHISSVSCSVTPSLCGCCVLHAYHPRTPVLALSVLFASCCTSRLTHTASLHAVPSNLSRRISRSLFCCRLFCALTLRSASHWAALHHTAAATFRTPAGVTALSCTPRATTRLIFICSSPRARLLPLARTSVPRISLYRSLMHLQEAATIEHDKRGCDRALSNDGALVASAPCINERKRASYGAQTTSSRN